LYVASRISGVGVLTIASRMGLIYGAAIGALLLVTYVPAVSMTMVELFR